MKTPSLIVALSLLGCGGQSTTSTAQPIRPAACDENLICHGASSIIISELCGSDSCPAGTHSGAFMVACELHCKNWLNRDVDYSYWQAGDQAQCESSLQGWDDIVAAYDAGDPRGCER